MGRERFELSTTPVSGGYPTRLDHRPNEIRPHFACY